MGRVFRRWQNLCMLLMLTLVIFMITLWLPSAPLILFILTHASPEDALNILSSLLRGLIIEMPFNVTAFSMVFSFLISLNVVLFTFFVRMTRVAQLRFSFNTFAGFIAGLFGLGCAACGSFLLSPGTFFIGGILVWLPYHGLELGYLGLFLLVFSAYKTTRAINSPSACPI